MWSRIVSLDRLTREGRWSVAFHAEVPDTPLSGYAAVPLKQVARQRREGVDPQAQPDAQWRYLGLENIASLTGDLVRFAPRPGAMIRSRSQVFQEGDVLFGRLRPSLNKVYLAESDQVADGICSGELIVLVPEVKRILPRVLRYVLASPFVQEHVARYQSGAALPRVAASDLLSLSIPLPPLDHQQRLEATLHRADRERRALRSRLEALPQATMEQFVSALGRGRLDPSD